MMVIKHTKLYDPGALSCQQGFSTNYCYDFDLTLKNNRVLPLKMVIKYTKLCDPGAYGSVSTLPTRSVQTPTDGRCYTIIRPI
jgi:hypothetical protein